MVAAEGLLVGSLIAVWAGLGAGPSLLPWLLGTFVGALGWTWAVGGGLSRPEVQRLSVRAGLVQALLVAFAYGVGANFAPELYGAAAEQPGVGAIAIGVVTWLCSFGLTLCGIDAWNSPWGGLNGGA